MGEQSQIAFWNGAAGERWTANQETLDRVLHPLGLAILTKAAPRAGERVLDLGCGCGATSVELARAVGTQGQVVGVDVSAPMLARARQRGQGVPGLSFVEADAAAHRFEAPFDLVFSRLGVMFFADPGRAFKNVFSATKPGGRIAFVCFRAFAENEWMRVPLDAAAAVLPPQPPVEPHAPGPHALADAERTRRLLREAGYQEVALEPHDALLVLGQDVSQAVAFLSVAGPVARLVETLEAAAVERVKTAVREALASRVTPQGIALEAAVWLVTGSRL